MLLGHKDSSKVKLLHEAFAHMTSSNSNMLHPEPGLLVLHTSSSKEKSLQDVEFSQSTSSKLKFKLVTPDCTQSISSKVNALQEEELEQNTSSNCI